MYFLIGVLIFNTFILGLNFCFLLIGGNPFHKGPEFAPIRIRGKTYSVERITVAVSVTVLGISWLSTWIYFMIDRWGSFVAQWESLLLHVVLQLFSSLGLIVAGFAIFKQWKSFRTFFLASIVLLVGSIGVSIAVYGPRGHGEPIFMYLFGLWTLVIGGVFTTAVYFLDQLIHDWDERLPQRKRLHAN